MPSILSVNLCTFLTPLLLLTFFSLFRTGVDGGGADAHAIVYCVFLRNEVGKAKDSCYCPRGDRVISAIE